MKSRPVGLLFFVFFCSFAHSQIANSSGVTHSSTVLKPASPKDADPVDLGTGLYIRSNTDLDLKDSIPIQFTRVYRNADPRSRAFGVGASNSYEMFIVGDSAKFSYVELILADGSRLHYNRISPGQDFASAVFEDTNDPTEFYRSRIRWNGNGWTVELQDGSSYKLRACNGNSKPGQCGVVEFRNAKGEVLQVVRERNGNVSRIVSPTGKWVGLTYDSQDRITRADDSLGRSVQYSYDDEGRLVKALMATGKVFTYQYDSQNRMTGAWEGPERILNSYAGDRCVRQTWWHNGKPHLFLFKYAVTAQGQIRETDVKEPNGTLRRVMFDTNGYQTRDTYIPITGEPLSIRFNRNSSTNNLNTITVTCSGRNATRRLIAPVGLARSGEVETNQLVSLCRDIRR
jgi:YD repeat-containing protein